MNLDQLIRNAGKLPPSPQILPKLQKLLRDENSSMSDIASLMKLDATLAAQVIRVSNSSYYASTERVNNIEGAVNRIGYNDVNKIVGAISSKNMFGDSLPLYNLQDGEAWKISILCATTMYMLAPGIELDGDIAYTIGLIHAIGMVIINNYYMEYGIIGSEIEHYPKGMSREDEKKLFGFDYGQAGAALLMKWNFPKEIYMPVQYQFTPHNCSKHREFACLLSLVKQAIEQFRAEPEELYESFNPDPKALEIVQMDAETLISTALDSESMYEWLANTI